MAVCLTSLGCIAVDLSIQGCVLHNNSNDLLTAYSSPGVTQFVLNRQCLSQTPQFTTTVPRAAANFTGIEYVAYVTYYCTIY